MKYINYFNREINGTLLIDKISGISSNSLLQEVKKIFCAKKAGHAGTLDPLATGMLAICLGESTKFSQYLLNSDKRYLVTAKLGEQTNTSDSEGQIINRRPVNIDFNILNIALNRFCGKIEQTPSMFSSLKYQGKPLYKYARQGISVPNKSRIIYVYNIKLISLENNLVKLEIYCSKGTYIRTIIDDLGEHLGCGAHVLALRRTEISHYSSERMVDIKMLQSISYNAPRSYDTLKKLDSFLLPIDSAVINIPAVNLNSDIAKLIHLGQTIDIGKQNLIGLVRITEGNEKLFLGIGEISQYGRLSPKRLISRPYI